MNAVQATDVRKNWGEFVDNVVRDKPQLVKRNRDFFVSLGLQHAKALTEDVRFHIELLPEDDGTVTATLDEIDLVVNAADEATAKQLLAADLVEYAQEYFNEFAMYYNAPNRRPHFRFVMFLLLQENLDDITRAFVLK